MANKGLQNCSDFWTFFCRTSGKMAHHSKTWRSGSRNSRWRVARLKRNVANFRRGNRLRWLVASRTVKNIGIMPSVRKSTALKIWFWEIDWLNWKRRSKMSSMRGRNYFHSDHSTLGRKKFSIKLSEFYIYCDWNSYFVGKWSESNTRTFQNTKTMCC